MDSGIAPNRILLTTRAICSNCACVPAKSSAACSTRTVTTIPETRRIVGAFKHNWQGDFARAENVERAKLWRYVCGDDNADVSFEGVLTRMSL